MDNLRSWFLKTCDGAKATLRHRHAAGRSMMVRRGVTQPPAFHNDDGAMLTVWHGRGMGYAAVCDLSLRGVELAYEQALAWAKACDQASVFDFSKQSIPGDQAVYEGPAGPTWSAELMKDLIDQMKEIDGSLGADERIVEHWVSLRHEAVQSTLYSTVGGEIKQMFSYFVPDMEVTAHAGQETQRRSMGGRGACNQGGLEILESSGWASCGPRLVEQAIELLTAPNCPTGKMPILLAPDQMVLQIHESIGHPLELDRILGDERNYAGPSFVTQDMFGTFQYGSALLNVSFDPTMPDQFASYAYDDDGTPAEKVMIIESGLLKTPLGGALSQLRAGMPGVAGSRTPDWNRPTMDRMANLNLEPGDSSMDAMVSQIEHGVYMESNCSWSIDDSRNKFQFGCEYGRLIENGELKGVIKNPNYRGISREFWRNLTAVGDASTVKVMGSPYCGKGEPNQMVGVGHASPTCLFNDVEVFGGAA